MKFIFSVLIVVFGLGFYIFRGCTSDANEAAAAKALENYGLKNVRILDKDIYFVEFKGCHRDDAVKFTAIAENNVGRNVKINICISTFFHKINIRIVE